MNFLDVYILVLEYIYRYSTVLKQWIACSVYSTVPQKGFLVDVVYMSFSEAFDNVAHGKLNLETTSS